jgi:hypothetical protein
MFAKRLSLRSAGRNACITIPMELCRFLNLRPGQRYDVVYDGHGKFIVDFTTGERTKIFEGSPIPRTSALEESVAA